MRGTPQLENLSSGEDNLVSCMTRLVYKDSGYPRSPPIFATYSIVHPQHPLLSLKHTCGLRSLVYQP